MSGFGPADRLEHNLFQFADNPMRMREGSLTSRRQLAPKDAPMRWIGFSRQEPVAVQVGENTRHRLRRHKRCSRQPSIRDPRLLFNDTQDGILCRGETERPQHVIHPRAQRVLRTLQRIPESLGDSVRNSLL
jgi:hypothetical protein